MQNRKFKSQGFKSKLDEDDLRKVTAVHLVFEVPGSHLIFIPLLSASLFFVYPLCHCAAH